MQEALIEGIRSMEQSKRAVDQLVEESPMHNMKSNNAVNVKHAVTSVTHNKIASASKQHRNNIENCVTRSKSANTQSANTESKSIHGPITRNKQKNTNKTARNKKKIENSVRRSERLRKKNIT